MSINAPSSLERYGILALRYFFGGHALVSGSNHFLHFIPEIFPKTPELAFRFMTSLLDSGLYDVVKIIETLCGLSLLTGCYMPLAVAIEMPVSVIVLYLSLFIAPTPRSFYTGPREVLMNGLLLTLYWGWFRTVFFTPQPAMRPFWRKSDGGAA